MHRIVFFVIVSILLQSQALAQWKNIAPFAIKPIDRSPNAAGGVIKRFGSILWAGYRDIWVSVDTGKTWAVRTPFNGKNNFCLFDIDVFDENTAVAVGNGDTVFITYDQGRSWKNIANGLPGPYDMVRFTGSANNIVTCGNYGTILATSNGGFSWMQSLELPFISSATVNSTGTVSVIGGDAPSSNLYQSFDRGFTWITQSGTFDWDSFSLESDPCDTATYYVVNEDIAVPTDNLSCVYVTRNSGKTWQMFAAHNLNYHSGSITASNGAVFVQTYQGVDRSTDNGLTWKSIGGPPNFVDTRFIAAFDENTVIAVDSFGSVWGTFNGGGDSVSASRTINYTFSSAKIVSDVVGATISLPIYLHFKDTMPSVDMVMHYPEGPLKYLGGFLWFGKSIDVPGSRSAGRATLHFDSEDLKTLSDSVVGYVTFKWFPQEFDCATILFDSLASPSVSCIERPFLSEKSFKGIIGAYDWCGQTSGVSEIKEPVTPLFYLTPNPAAESAMLHSLQYSGKIQFRLFDLNGKLLQSEHSSISIDGPMKIHLRDLSSGVYHLSILAGLLPPFDLTFVHYKE